MSIIGELEVGGVFMKDNYSISKETLSAILRCAGSMLEVGNFMVNEHRDKVDTFRGDVFCDGVACRLESNYDDIKRLVNVVCNDGRVE